MTDLLSLLAHYHIESALLAALAGAFWGGWAGGIPGRRDDFSRMIRIVGFLWLAGLPLLVRDLLQGCFTVHGLGFWLLYPAPSVAFGYAVGRLFREWGLSRPRLWAVGTLATVAIGIFLFEFFTLPQVYFYNHIWGGWPGPLYDEVIELDGSLLYFRGLTLSWAILLWYLPRVRDDRFSAGMAAGAVLMLLLGYSSLAEMGIVSPEEHLREKLGGHRQTEHFDLWYDREAYDDFEVNMRAAELEFHLQGLADTLKLDRDSFRVQVYLYAHPWQKKKLTGAKFTSYVPVWLSTDQVHIASGQLGSLRHELVHVAAKRFGNRLLNASWSIGLVEGLAVALAPEPGRASSADQLVAADPPWPGAERLRASFSFRGFYEGRPALNYTTSGSFVRYLLRRYPVDFFKKAYRKGDLDGAYTVSMDSLAAGWHRHLETVPVDSGDAQAAERLFSIPSLLELSCPHRQSAEEAEWDRYRFLRAAGDTAGALASLDRLVALTDSIPAVMAEWGYRNLAGKRAGRVRKAADLSDSLADLQMLYGDAFLLSGDTLKARRHLRRARAVADSSTLEKRSWAFRTRASMAQWVPYVDLTYRGNYPGTAEEGTLLARTLLRATERAMERRHWEVVDRLEKVLIEKETDREFADTYLRLIHTLAFRGRDARAGKWIEKMKALPEPGGGTIELLELEAGWIRFNSRDR